MERTLQRKTVHRESHDDQSVPDEMLALRAASDPSAFAPLYTRYIDPIYRYCFRSLGTREAAEAFVKVDPFVLEGLVKSYVIRDWNDTMLE